MCKEVRQNKSCLNIYLRKVAIGKSCKTTHFVACNLFKHMLKMKKLFFKDILKRREGFKICSIITSDKNKQKLIDGFKHVLEKINSKHKYK
jgi:hypothetical protein